MNGMRMWAAGVSAAILAGGGYAAAPAKDPPPVADYWMDVTTQSGLGAGANSGAMSAAAVMNAMRGGSSVNLSLDLRLASRTRPTGAAQADHFVPPAMQMGASLPLITPARVEAPRSDGMPGQWQQPKGRMLIYWGCGEHVGAGQPTVIDFSKMQPGQMPPGMAAMANMARVVAGPHSAPGFGRWPNEKDSRQVPSTSSLVGAHRIKANYAPDIAFSLAAGQDFMPPLGLREAGSLPSGATRLMWNSAPQATGYALAMFGANGNGDVVMWSSASKAAMSTLDYLAPAEVKRQIAAGNVLPPTTSQCLLPAEVATASPAGMVMGIGYGPEVSFAEKPQAPKWVAKVRYKTTASLMHGMAGMMGGAMDGYSPSYDGSPTPGQQPPKKKKRGLLGDIIEGATGLPLPR